MPHYITNRDRVLIKAGMTACFSADHFSFELIKPVLRETRSM